eukprot:CAMPEP_0114286784 /NCGR_PEP_ID=MMETSP0059-20121206/5935_1 /TAXON_ID=36894 /ORGANISM="Pyramimonas parkeae, Strain CCMP726" /LENGTH=144 /DNA_ID=CAMNT_0001407833 /DNA_START=233 /DNA_END=664 /DNA_ORIENTATION=-
MPLEKAFPIPMIAATTTSENTLRCANSASAANPLAINERLNTAVGRLPTLSIIHPAAGESSKSIAFPAEVTIPTWMASSPRLCAANGMASPRALRNTCSAKHAIPAVARSLLLSATMSHVSPSSSDNFEITRAIGLLPATSPRA